LAPPAAAAAGPIAVRPVKLPEATATPFKDDATYLITGGFGGIGLTIATDLMTRHRATIILLTRTALPDRTLWDKHLRTHSPQDKTAGAITALRRLEALPGRVIVAVADVCDVGEMRAAIAQATEKNGRISGVIHAAGTIDDGPLLAKTPLEVEAVFAPKVNGLRVLDAVFPDGTLDLMVLFSSSSTTIRAAGQVDYVAANEYLNAVARARKGSKTKVISLNWGVWTGVGMAAEATARAPDTAPATPTTQPMLPRAGFDATGNRIFTGDLTTEHWLLDEHRTRAGDALLPGTGYLEIAAQALAAQEETGAFEVRDLTFFSALDVGAEGRELLVRLAPGDDGQSLEIRSSVTLDNRKGHLLNATATLLPLTETPGRVDLAALAARCPDRHIGKGTRLRSSQEAQLIFGPRWQVIETMAFGAEEGLATLALPDAFRGDLEAGFRLHPGLLDLATGWAIALAPGYCDEHLWVPLSYGTVRVFAPLPARIASWMRLTPGMPRQDGFVSFDVTITDRHGNIVVEIYDFAMKRLATAAAFGKGARVAASEIAFADTANRPLSPDEERLAETVANGIRPAEGAEALRRALAVALATDSAQITVSSLDLSALVRQAAQPRRSAAAQGQTFERPQLDGDFVAPGNAIEETLAGFWQSLLGITQVGVEDSFFDLGGHSLIAVRLFAQINKAFGVQFPISVLFEAPTIAACAALIAARVGHVTGGAADAGSSKPAQQSFDHLVALHQGNGGAKTPLFIVAGMFGNVMNLRHLGLSLGQDRPVYGLQARGLLGDADPHRTIPEAAAAYIAELRRVQPEGPYLLGGFSGGGITAYEMAQQLDAEGREVSVLALLDTPLPVRPVLSRRDKLIIKGHEIRAKGPKYLAEWARNRIAWEIARRRAPEGPAPEAAFDNAKIEAAFRGAVEIYGLAPWNGPLTLFRPALDRHWVVSKGNFVTAQREYAYHDNQWTDFAPRIEVIEVPGDHDGMVLVPNVSVLAARLKQVIRTAERSHRAPRWAQQTAAE